MDGEIKIRKATLKDLNIVFQIFKTAIKVMDSNCILQWDDIYPDKDILNKDIQKEEMFLGEIEGKIVSVFVLNQEYEEEYDNGNWKHVESKFAVIHRLCVNPIFQNKKIGTKTVNKIEEMLRQNGIESIRLDAFSLNPYALKLYKNLGYIKVGKVEWRKGQFYLFEKLL